MTECNECELFTEAIIGWAEFVIFFILRPAEEICDKSEEKEKKKVRND